MINWRLAQTRQQQDHHKKQFGLFFKRPTKSASQVALRTGAAGAALAEQRGIPHRAVSIFDSARIKQAHVATTSSARTHEILKQREVGTRSSTSEQVLDKTTRRGIDTLQQDCKKTSGSH